MGRLTVCARVENKTNEMLIIAALIIQSFGDYASLELLQMMFTCYFSFVSIFLNNIPRVAL